MANHIQWKKLNELATVPERKTSGAAGYDLCVLVDTLIRPGCTVRAPTGLAVAIPVELVGLIKPRSSAFFRGLDLDGTIDSDYRGEVGLQIRNTSCETILLKAGERVAQMVVVPHYYGPSEEVEKLDETGRGKGGFGSTGQR